jgi:hypothetical protein
LEPLSPNVWRVINMIWYSWLGAGNAWKPSREAYKKISR